MEKKKIGLSFLQVPAYYAAPGTEYSVMEETAQLDKFAQVMKMVQNLSDDTPFRPEWLFNSELPEEIKLYLRNVFMQRIKGITSSLDVTKLSDEQLMEFVPTSNETLADYSSRVTAFINSVKESGE